jgi:hypothetical protein
MALSVAASNAAIALRHCTLLNALLVFFLSEVQHNCFPVQKAAQNDNKHNFP